MIPSEDHSHLPEINPQNIKSATYLIWASRIENHWFKEALHNTHTHTHTHTHNEIRKTKHKQNEKFEKDMESVKKNQTNSGAELILKMN